MDVEELQRDYQLQLPKVHRFADGLKAQLLELLSQQSITVGAPIELRVKSWNSISEKISRASLELEQVTQLNDLVGLRLILLFKRDLDRACTAMAATFEVQSKEDTSDRLDESHFGYQSLHYTVKVPVQWLSLPTFRDCQDFCAEIQIRTLAQHIWAAASHRLQYKQESGVPFPVRRAIHRVSALLETVDLEFERVLTERDDYLASPAANSPDESLYVDVLARILDKNLPSENRGESEDYGELLEELKAIKLDSPSKLEQFIKDNYDAALQHDQHMVGVKTTSNDKRGTSESRLDRGVYFTHVGLVRTMFNKNFGTFRFADKD